MRASRLETGELLGWARRDIVMMLGRWWAVTVSGMLDICEGGDEMRRDSGDGKFRLEKRGCRCHHLQILPDRLIRLAVTLTTPCAIGLDSAHTCHVLLLSYLDVIPSPPSHHATPRLSRRPRPLPRSMPMGRALRLRRRILHGRTSHTSNLHTAHPLTPT